MQNNCANDPRGSLAQNNLTGGNVHPEFSAKDNKRKSNYSVRGNHFSEISDLQNIGGSDKLLVRFDPCLKYIH
jgi:hypothetical protein